jgi:hypothetical protein
MIALNLNSHGPINQELLESMNHMNCEEPWGQTAMFVTNLKTVWSVCF